MSIEFGILREASTITLMGEYRVVLTEEEFDNLKPMFEKIEATTGQEIESWGDAEFDQDTLPSFIESVKEELAKWECEQFQDTLAEMVRVAEYALSSGRKLSFFGD